MKARGAHRNATSFMLCVSLALAGCTTAVVNQPVAVTEKLGQVPQVGSVADATVGSTVFSQYRYWSKTGYRLREPVNTRLLVGTIHTEAGDFVLPATLDGEPAYCTERPAYGDVLAGPFSTACFVDRSRSGTFDVVKARPGMVWLETRLANPVGYERGELQVPRPDSKKSELLYQGFSAKTLKLSYREYVNDFARPAFFQDVSYEISDFPATVTFRSVRINIISADNNGIRYQVISGF